MEGCSSWLLNIFSDTSQWSAFKVIWVQMNPGSSDLGVILFSKRLLSLLRLGKISVRIQLLTNNLSKGQSITMTSYDLESFYINVWNPETAFQKRCLCTSKLEPFRVTLRSYLKNRKQQSRWSHWAKWSHNTQVFTHPIFTVNEKAHLFYLSLRDLNPLVDEFWINFHEACESYYSKFLEYFWNWQLSLQYSIWVFFKFSK